jgi:16S rRNA processing protein RimM
MNSNEDYYFLGTLSKTHGVNGELVLKLNNPEANDMEETGPVFIEFDGLLVPFFVNGLFSKNYDSVVVKFEDLDSAEQASEFVNCKVFSPYIVSPVSDEPFTNPASMIGYEVIDKKYGNIGKIEEFVPTPNNPLFRIMKSKREILLPVNDEFILDIDDTNKTVSIDAPEGLIDLYS